LNEREDIRRELRDRFGDGIFTASGELNRPALASIVFSDRSRLEALNRIVWPALVQEIEDTIRRLRKENPDVPIVLDMAVLFETGCQRLCDVVIAVNASPERRIRWLQAYRGWDETEIRRRMAAQMDAGEKSAMADIVVENDGTPEDLEREARNCIRRMDRPFRRS